MKKYLSLLFVALFATMTFALSSCSDDNNDTIDPEVGAPELNIDGKTYKFNTATCNVTNDVYSCTVWNSQNSDGILIVSIYQWASTDKSTTLTYDNLEVTWNNKSHLIMGHPTAASTTKVLAKSATSITLQFKNAEFENTAGDEKFTVNGIITLPVE